MPAHRAGCPGKAQHAAFVLSLEHSIATTWPAAQKGRQGEEKRREEGRETSVSHLAAIHTQAEHGGAIPGLADAQERRAPVPSLLLHALHVVRVAPGPCVSEKLLL